MNDLTGQGRIPSVPSLSAQFPLAAVKPKRTQRNWLLPGGVDDQGNTPECVAYAGNHLLAAHPVSGHKFNAHLLYKDCQRNDQWAGEAYDGTSVLGLMRVLRRFGIVSEYRWAWTAEPVRAHVLEQSPVIVGTSFYMGMANPMRASNGDAYMTPTGQDIGGHAYMINGASDNRQNPDLTRGAFRIVNSWGGRWGDRGMAWISYQHMDALIRDRGEAAAATEVRRA